MNKLFMSAVLTIAMTVANVATAAPSKDHYVYETWAATQIVYNMALFQFDADTLTTGIEPVMCWPFPVYWEEFYRTVQDNINAQVESYPKREQGRLGVSIGWRVWNAVQDIWGC